MTARVELIPYIYTQGAAKPSCLLQFSVRAYVRDPFHLFCLRPLVFDFL